MANPVLSRPGAFTSAPGYGQAAPGYAPGGYQQNPYGPQAGYQQYPAGQQPQGYEQYGPTPGQQFPPAQAPQDRMTIDDVITKTAITLGCIVLVAALGWTFLPLETLLPISFVAGLVTIIFPLVAAFRRGVGPGFAIAYAAVEGLFLGGISKYFEAVYPGIVMQAVIATFIATAVTLGAFHFGGFRLSSKFRKILMLSVIAYAIVALLNLVLSLLGVNLGIVAGVTGDVSAMAWLFAGLGVVLAVLSLVDDFQYIEAGVQMGAPASESWRAAWGLSVTLVWLYWQLLRILSYIRRD
ncbi:MAG: Bax inhibitor-1/YccA family protein [Propionibacteriaceae bacterium]|nr:Bax inhibitor-1/YccA family protein [Propionibacteriaceae bacterium]